MSKDPRVIAGIIFAPLMTLAAVLFWIPASSNLAFGNSGPAHNNAEPFTIRTASVNLVSSRQTSQKKERKDVSSWHISQDPDKAKGDPYTAMTCLFKGQRRIFCPENGLGSFSISTSRGSILAWGAGAFHVPNWGTKIVAVLDLNGEVLKVWETTGTYAFRGKGIPEHDVLVVAYQTDSSTTDGKGIVHVRSFDYEGNTRWHRQYPDTFLSDFGVASNASFSVLLLGSAARGGKSLILNSSGKLLQEAGPAAAFAIAPNDSWVLLWDAGRTVVIDPRRGQAIFRGDFPPKDRRRVWYAGSSKDGKQLIVLESSAGEPTEGAPPRTDKIHVIDLQKREISFTSIEAHDTIGFSAARIDAEGHICLTFGGTEYEYEVVAK